MDIDIILAWPLKKIYGYMSYYRTQTEEFKKQQKSETPISFNEIVRLMERDGVVFK